MPRRLHTQTVQYRGISRKNALYETPEPALLRADRIAGPALVYACSSRKGGCHTSLLAGEGEVDAEEAAALVYHIQLSMQGAKG